MHNHWKQILATFWCHSIFVILLSTKFWYRKFDGLLPETMVWWIDVIESDVFVQNEQVHPQRPPLITLYKKQFGKHKTTGGCNI